MKNNNYFIILITLGFSLLHLLYLSCAFAQTDSIANERLPVKAKQLEAHWQVDCIQSLSKAQSILVATSSADETIEAIHDDLIKCMHIYNTPDTAHFKPKPDYKTAVEKLNNFLD